MDIFCIFKKYFFFKIYLNVVQVVSNLFDINHVA